MDLPRKSEGLPSIPLPQIQQTPSPPAGKPLALSVVTSPPEQEAREINSMKATAHRLAVFKHKQQLVVTSPGGTSSSSRDFNFNLKDTKAPYFSPRSVGAPGRSLKKDTVDEDAADEEEAGQESQPMPYPHDMSSPIMQSAMRLRALGDSSNALDTRSDNGAQPQGAVFQHKISRPLNMLPIIQSGKKGGNTLLAPAPKMKRVKSRHEAHEHRLIDKNPTTTFWRSKPPNAMIEKSTEDDQDQPSISHQHMPLISPQDKCHARLTQTVKGLAKGVLFFSPYGRVKRAWDWVILMFVFYNCVLVPYLVAFDPVLSGNPYVSGLDWFIIFLWLVDILASFRTAYIDTHGDGVVDAQRIKERYLRSYRFSSDVIGTLPIALLFTDLLAYATGWNIDLCRSLLRLNYLARADRLYTNDPLGRAASRQAPIARIVRLLFFFLYLAHCFACFFFWISVYQPADEWSKVESWAEKADLLDASIATQYVSSLYFALTTMTTVGYGDISPTTVYERLSAVPVLLLSTLIYASIFGSVTTAIAQLNAMSRKYQESIDSVEEFAKSFDLSDKLRKKMVAYTQENFNQDKGFELTKLTSSLPESVRTEVMSHMYKGLLGAVPMFKEESDPRFIEMLVLELKNLVCLDGDYIFKKGDTSREMYFVRKGTVRVLIPDPVYTTREKEVARMGQGAYFGELAVILGEARTASVQAVARCNLAFLTFEGLNAALVRFPEIGESMRSTAMRRLKRDVVRSESMKMRSIRATSESLSVRGSGPSRERKRRNSISQNRLIDLDKSMQMLEKAKDMDLKSPVLRGRRPSFGTPRASFTRSPSPGMRRSSGIAPALFMSHNHNSNESMDEHLYQVDQLRGNMSELHDDMQQLRGDVKSLTDMVKGLLTEGKTKVRNLRVRGHNRSSSMNAALLSPSREQARNEELSMSPSQVVSVTAFLSQN